MSRLADLDDVPWAQLHTYRPDAGHRLPGLLARAADPDVFADKAWQALAAVDDIVGYSGMIWEAAAYLPRFLARIAQRPEHSVREEALDLLDTVVRASSGKEPGEKEPLPYVLQRELLACLPDLRAVPGPHAEHLVSLIESGLVPGGVVADRWRTQARAFLAHRAARLFIGSVEGSPVLITAETRTHAGITFWDAEAGKQIGPACDGIALDVYHDRSGLVVAAASGLNRIMQWRVPTGEGMPHLKLRRNLGQRLRRHKPDARAMTTYRDGTRTIAVAGDDYGVLRYFDVATRQAVRRPSRIGDEVTALWSYEWAGEVGLAAGGSSGRVWRWRPDAGEEPCPVAGKHHQLVMHGTAYTDGDRTVLVTGATDQAVYRWDAETGVQIADRWILPDVVGGICTYTVDGRLIVAVGSFYQVQRFDARTGEPFGEPIQGHRETIMDTCFAEIGGRPTLFTCDWSSVWRWDAATGEPLPS